MVELASATPLVGHDYSNFRRAVGKLIFMAPWRPDMQFAIRQLSTQVFNPTTEKQARSETVDTISQRHANTLVFVLDPRGMVQKEFLELVGRSDSEWAGDSATRQNVTGYHCDVQSVTMCK